MIKTVKYKDRTDRQTLVAKWEAQGYEMVSDTFDPDWERGQEIRGTMIFTDVHPPSPTIAPVRDLAHELDVLKERVILIEEARVAPM